MLKIVTTINNRRTLILGLERANTERMHNDNPIVVDLQALRQHADYDEPFQDLVIIAEETTADVHARLLSVGLPLPPYKDVGPDDPAYMFGPKR